ncbi:hypothetical protein ACP4OV_012720 [Aristida adscensionis]
MASPQECNSPCLKRKLIDDCLSKECKSRRVTSESGPASDSSAKRCNCCCTRPNLANDCVNFLKSGVPSRIMYYKQGSWNNFPEQIMKSLIEEFRGNKSSVVAVMDDEPLLIDFLSMTLVNLKTRKQRSVAWFDESGKCFYPSLFFDEDSDEPATQDPGKVDGTLQGISPGKVANSPPEVVKQVVLESSPPVPQKPSTVDVLRKKITSVERGSEDFLFVQNLFLSGMGSFAAPSSILHVYRYSPNDITAQCRLEAFERQMRSTKEERGDANIRYGWLGSKKNDIVRILINGLGTNAKHVEKASLSAGVYLSPENRAFTSVGLCDVDEKGVQYMLLCRMILGNMEAIEPGSQECFPSSEIYDSGVDDCSNPKCYVMWPSHLSTHIRLEYLISFKLVPKVRNYLLGLKGLWFHPSPKEVAVDISTLEPVMGVSGEGPTAPWISFRVLFGVIKDNISSVARELLFHHYEELKESIITREEMVKKMIIIVGEKILLEALKKLHYSPSLWYKPCAEAASGDPARAAPEQLSLDEMDKNCSLTLNVNQGDSHAPNAMAEHSGPSSTKGCDALATGTVPKGHDLAPNGVPEASSSAGVMCQGSPSMESKVRDSPVQIVSPGNSAAQSAKNHDSFVARVAPVVRDGLLRTTGRSGSPGVEVCNSVAPPGYASLAPANDSKPHRALVAGLASKDSESVVPCLALGNSKSMGVKRLNSAPRKTSEGQEFLSLGIASQSPPVHSVKGQECLTPVSVIPVHAPIHRNLSSVPTEVRDSLALSIRLKGHHDLPALYKRLKRHEAPRAATVPETSDRPQAQDAPAKVHDAPTPTTGEPKDQVALCGPQNKSSGPGPDAKSHAAGAANALIALSTPREKGGH